MENLIRSLQIIEPHIPFRASRRDPEKCVNRKWPTHCEHDVLMVPSITEEVWEQIPEDEKKELEALGGWFLSEEYYCLCSFRFGSC